MQDGEQNITFDCVLHPSRAETADSQYFLRRPTASSGQLAYGITKSFSRPNGHTSSKRENHVTETAIEQSWPSLIGSTRRVIIVDMSVPHLTRWQQHLNLPEILYLMVSNWNSDEEPRNLPSACGEGSAMSLRIFIVDKYPDPQGNNR